MNSLDKFIEKIPEFSSERNYWFVRTDGGKYFDYFYENNLIAIGWNEITAKDIREKTPGAGAMRIKIAKANYYDINTSKGKSKVTGVVNKLSHFANHLKEGDIVVMPSHGSSRIAIGEIRDTKIFENISKDQICDYQKRKKVLWYKQYKFSELDSIFYRIKRSQHAITNITPYASYIDRYTKSVFQKNGHGHLIIDVKSKEEISALSLFETWIDLINLTDEFSKENDIEFRKEQVHAKINVQSPGNIELITLTVTGLATLGMVLAAIIGADFSFKSETLKIDMQFKTEGAISKISKFLSAKKKREIASKIQDNLGEMKTDTTELIEAMKNLDE